MREVWRFKILGCVGLKKLWICWMWALQCNAKIKTLSETSDNIAIRSLPCKNLSKKIEENRANFHARTRYVFIMEGFGPPENTNFYMFHVLNVLKRWVMLQKFQNFWNSNCCILYHIDNSWQIEWILKVRKLEFFDLVSHSVSFPVIFLLAKKICCSTLQMRLQTQSNEFFPTNICLWNLF